MTNFEKNARDKFDIPVTISRKHTRDTQSNPWPFSDFKMSRVTFNVTGKKKKLIWYLGNFTWTILINFFGEEWTSIFYQKKNRFRHFASFIETWWNFMKLSETFSWNFLWKLHAISKSWKLSIYTADSKYRKNDQELVILWHLKITLC